MTTTLIVIGALLVICLIIPIILLIWIWMRDEKQEEHSVLRNYPVIGKLRFIFEKIGPELRQYLFLNDREELPLLKKRIRAGGHVSGKYKKSRTMGFGSKRDFDKPGYYIRNVLFPKQRNELRIDQSEKIKTKKVCIRLIKTIY
ncbi:hypothetical protein BsIDN1_12480 [Bacillus safensis]|uniref:Uncharacterized protein n=1 Tax=Bacillus safensis TaxID=561879 RepID=A0A5S9M217_BACIA|nr:hypothetical protein BsIDN1_12480 [Bacillus safensis]